MKRVGFTARGPIAKLVPASATKDNAAPSLTRDGICEVIPYPMKTPDLTPVSPAKPVAPYLGGKRNLAGRLVPIIDAIPCTTYVEPFVGMGGVFLRRKARPRCEVINDYGREVSNLFRIIQRHYPQFLEVLRFQLTVRAEFERLTDTDPTTLTDLERAARFLYLQRTAFGGKLSGRSFGVAKDRPGRFNLHTVEPLLEDLHSRLAGVIIECLDFADVIRRYDSAQALFYLDPPYWGNEGDYGKDLFGRDRFTEMAELLGGIKGRFILSLNDCPAVREVFAAFNVMAVKTSYTISAQANGAKVGEVLISNGALKGS